MALSLALVIHYVVTSGDTAVTFYSQPIMTSKLKCRCPIHNIEITTSVADRDTLRRMHGMRISVWCPHCIKPHQIQGNDAYLLETEENDAPSDPDPLNWSKLSAILSGILNLANGGCHEAEAVFGRADSLCLEAS